MNSSSEYKEVEILDAPDKSPFDKNQYRLIRLPNGIKSLLISPYDGTVSSTEKTTTSATTPADVETADEYYSACALVVDVGSNSDPQDVQGMSHFLGTQKISALIAQHLNFNSFKYFAQNIWYSWVPKNFPLKMNLVILCRDLVAAVMHTRPMILPITL